MAGRLGNEQRLHAPMYTKTLPLTAQKEVRRRQLLTLSEAPVPQQLAVPAQREEGRLDAGACLLMPLRVSLG